MSGKALLSFVFFFFLRMSVDRVQAYEPLKSLSVDSGWPSKMLSERRWICPFLEQSWVCEVLFRRPLTLIRVRFDPLYTH